MSVLCNVAYNDPYIYVVNLQLPLLLSTSVMMYPFLYFHDVPRYAHLHCILLEQYLILQLTLCVLSIQLILTLTAHLLWIQAAY